MKKTIGLLAFIIFTAIRIQAQSQYCLMGDCEDSLSLLKEYEAGAVKFTLSNGFRTNKYKRILPEIGTALTFRVGHLAEVSIGREVWNNHVQKSPDRGPFITESTMSVSVNGLLPRGATDTVRYVVGMGVAVYFGLISHEKPDGPGKLEYDAHHELAKVMGDTPVLSRFVGSFRAGQPDGPGRLYYSNGHSDSVRFEDGVLVWPQTPDQAGFREGCISGNCGNGWGTYVWNHSQVYRYTGVFRNGIPSVFGMFQYMNGELYIGELNDSSQYQGSGCFWHYPYVQENGFFDKGEYLDNSAGYVENAMDAYTMNKSLTAYNGSGPATNTPGVCNYCRGKGVVDAGICKKCHGRGSFHITHYRASNNILDTKIHNDGSRTITYEKQGFFTNGYECNKCHGTGRNILHCSYCKGTGKN